jgi:hypothetical protein
MVVGNTTLVVRDTLGGRDSAEDAGSPVGIFVPVGTETVDGNDADGSGLEGNDADGNETDSSDADGNNSDGSEIDGKDTDGSEGDGNDVDGTESTDGSEKLVGRATPVGSETDGGVDDGSEFETDGIEGGKIDGNDTEGEGTNETERTEDSEISVGSTLLVASD